MDDTQVRERSRPEAESASGHSVASAAAATDPQPAQRGDLSQGAKRLSQYGAPASGGLAIDHLLHAWQAQFTAGLSPTGLALGWWDWALHLMNSPGKQAELGEAAIAAATSILRYAASVGAERPEPMTVAAPEDHRFRAAAWSNPPFDILAQGFLIGEDWLLRATTGVPGVRQRHERVVSFLARQCLDAVSPANFPISNPEVLQKAWRDGGLNFILGAMNAWDDLRAKWTAPGAPPTEPYRVGRDIAATPGKVVLRNRLMELIQYAPTTPKVVAQPILLVPAWIMKYYILDLSARSSLVRYLVDRGFTVFAISWKNPGAEDRDIGLDDYRELGIMAALEAIGAIVPEQRVHAAGYCLGGTLLAIAAAEMAREDDDRLASVTLLTAQVDFTEAGELLTFISEDQIAFLEDEMWVRGYLDATHMSGMFQALRSNDLVWAHAVRQYLLGERDGLTDLMAWNRDTTRMPYRMQTEYLRQLFFGNDLARGRYLVDGKPLALGDIDTPIFAVATEGDHVAPWRSVYKIALLTKAELTFVLTKGGHNGGVVSEPGHRGRVYRLHCRRAGDPSIDADGWLAMAERRDGSWWESWVAWLDARSGAKDALPPPFGATEQGYPVLEDAPGRYVHMQ